ncbi:hypothetical protein E4T56_gene6085, partial [Termitomyces sp. T112]
MAIEKAGSLDRDQVRDELAKLDVVTFFGPVKFGTNGQVNSLDPPVFQLQGGKPVVLFPQAIKQDPDQRAGAGLSLCLHRDRLFPSLGSAERHQPDPRLLHRARGLSRVRSLQQPAHLAL